MRRSGRDPLKQYQTEPMYNIKFYTMNIGTVVLWVTTTCSLVVDCTVPMFRSNILPSFCILKVEAERFSDKLWQMFQTTRRHYPEETYERIRSL